MLLIMIFLCSCYLDKKETTNNEINIVDKKEDNMKELKLFIDDNELAVKWNDNDSVKELQNLVNDELIINMSRYGGFEQVGSLGFNLPRNDTSITTKAGDIVLYSGNQIVIFYGSNNWSYTKLGEVEDIDRLIELISDKDVNLKLKME